MPIEVTIGICVKNAGSTIGDAVKSILSQDFPLDLIEVIIVDGLSRDKTVEIIESMIPRGRLKHKIFYADMGLGDARQIVVENASSPYVLWVDGDMALSEDFVSGQLEFMKQNKTAAIAKGSYGLLKDDGLVANLENLEFIVDSVQYSGKSKSNNVLGTSGCIYRLSAIKQIGGFDRKLRGVGEDQDAEHRLKAAGWSLFVSKPIFYEQRRRSWHSLWSEYVWHGKGARSLVNKNARAINLRKMLPPLAIASEFHRSIFAYRITRKKVVFLLPLHWAFKRVAWVLGFLSV
jgi:glycosyltransferase involved in cell wall biosynthesis